MERDEERERDEEEGEREHGGLIELGCDVAVLSM